MKREIDALVEERRVIVCCGSGGVGKTTSAAVLALEGARRGRHAVVVTIDPARRLANALGLTTLSDVPTEVHRGYWDPDGLAPPSGMLSALMLDTKSTFDRLVHRYAETPEQAERILDNAFYRNVSGVLSGTQEFMAMEKLYELHEEGRFDLIVVDTPPSRHALDFLDAPRRLVRLLDNRVFRILMAPTRAGVKVTGFALRTFLHTIARVVGSEVIDDTVAFFRTFEGMEEGFRQRATAVDALIADPRTGFVLVTSPRRDSLDEARFFTEQLEAHELTVDALIVNLVHPKFTDAPVSGLRSRADDLAARAGDDEPARAAHRLGALYGNLADFQEIATHERGHLDAVAGRVAPDAIAYVPFLPRDVHDFDALTEVGRFVFGPDGDAG